MSAFCQVSTAALEAASVPCAGATGFSERRAASDFGGAVASEAADSFETTCRA